MLVCLFVSVLFSFQSTLDDTLRLVDDEKGITVSAYAETLGGDLIHDFRGGESLTMASNTKLFTTAASLLALGKDFRWRTKFYLIDQDLYVLASGDPGWLQVGNVDYAEKIMDDVASSLRQSSIKKIDNLYICVSQFPEQRSDYWPKDQSSKPYCAPPAGMTIYQSVLELELKKDGSVVGVPSLPSYVSISRHTKPSKYFSAWWGNDFDVWYQAPPKSAGRIPLSVKDADVYFKSWFASELEERSFTVDNSFFAEEVPSEAEEFFYIDSPLSCAEVCTIVNKESDNFLAEMLLFSLARQKNLPATYKNGTRQITSVLAEHAIDLPSLSLLDGSGMSRSVKKNNVASPRDICRLLSSLACNPVADLYFDTLPVGGVDGSLKYRFVDPLFQPQRVHAKTGFIYSAKSKKGSGASSLSGYLLLESNEVVVFSILINFDRAVNSNTNNKRFKALQEEWLKGLFLEKADE